MDVLASSQIEATLCILVLMLKLMVIMVSHGTGGQKRQ